MEQDVKGPEEHGKLQSTKGLGQSFLCQGPSGESEASLDRLRMANPKYKNRPDRLDLLSHGLVDITAQVGSKSYSLCDISEGGFSYGQHIPITVAMSLPNLWRKTDHAAAALHGKTLPFSFSFINQPERNLQIFGQVRNHRLFFGLRLEDIERELKNFFFKRGIRGDRDPDCYFAKAESLLHQANEIVKNGLWDAANNLALNMTMINFFEEMGASENFFDGLWMGYEKRPLFLKFGIAIPDKHQAKKLVTFADYHGEMTVTPEEREKQQKRKSKDPYIDRLHQEFSAKKLLSTIWRQGLKHFNLPEGGLVLPKEEDKKNVFLRELQTLPLEEIFDADYWKKPSATIEHLIDSFHWLLMDEDPKWLKRAVVAKEVLGLSQAIFEAVLKKMGWVDQAQPDQKNNELADAK